MTQQKWEILKWVGNICLVVSTLMMVNAHVASTSITPWSLFFAGNTIWFADSARLKNYPWAAVSFLLILWDILIIATRLDGGVTHSILQPLISIMENIP